MTHCRITVNLLHHVKCLSGKFDQFHTEFHTYSLFLFAVHDKIADVVTNMVRIAPVAQLLKFTAMLQN